MVELMSLFSKLLGIASIFCFFACIFFVIFGQFTVRRLRKNEETKHALGVEFLSGWDIINVAQTLSIPRSWSKKLESSPLSFLNAQSEILFKHTSRVDRFLAGLFYWLLNFRTYEEDKEKTAQHTEILRQKD